MQKSGFTLLEMSIVLVIIGLIAGGVLVGQDLLRAAKVRNVGKDIGRIMAAVNTFNEKYNGLPGDITNATTIWGAANATPATCVTTQGTTTQTCNGNGDGRISDYWTGAAYYENFRAWQQLSNAGLFEGSYTGIAGPSDTRQDVPGTNSPLGPIANSSYDFVSATGMGVTTDATAFFPLETGNFIEYGTAMTTDAAKGAVLTPGEVQSLDAKLDDGLPGQGAITVWRKGGGYDINKCATTTDPLTAAYLISYADVACPLFHTY